MKMYKKEFDNLEIHVIDCDDTEEVKNVLLKIVSTHVKVDDKCPYCEEDGITRQIIEVGVAEVKKNRYALDGVLCTKCGLLGMRCAGDNCECKDSENMK